MGLGMSSNGIKGLYNLNVKPQILELANLQYRSLDDLLMVCEERLQSQIAKSSAAVKIFFGLNDVEITCLADLPKLPVKTSIDIWRSQQLDPPFGIYNGCDFDQIRSSKGTTKFQKFWPYTNEAWSKFLIGKARLFQNLKLDSRDILLSLDSGGTPVGIPTTVDACAVLYDVKIISAGVLPIIKKAELVHAFSVTAIVGLPDMIIKIGKVLKKQNKSNSISKIISVGKSISPHLAELCELFPRAKIVDDVGCSELSVFAFSCEHKKRHFNIDLTYITVDESGLINATGLTSANPIFNYQTGDRLKNFRYEHCECGSCLPIFDEFVER